VKKFLFPVLYWTILLGLTTGCGGNEPVKLVATWGGKGSGPGQLLYVEDFAFDPHGNLLVTDALRADVQVFSRQGEFIARVNGNDDIVALEKPEGVALDAQGNIWVGDYLNGHILKYDKAHRQVGVYSELGSAPGQTFESEFMTITEGLLFIAEAGNHRISVFNMAGEFEYSFGELGTGEGQMNRPEAAKHDSAGRIVVADFGNHRIQFFTPAGEFLGAFGREGGEPGQFRRPTGIALDARDNIYVCDSGNNRVQVFDRAGAFLYEFGSRGTSAGQFLNLHGIIVDEEGYIYVADTGNNRIQKFAAKG
jgi:DNA-binding beta-propeller fold protein YncE